MKSFNFLKQSHKLKSLTMAGLLAVAALLITSCTDDYRCIQGKGNYETRYYDLGEFNELAFYGDGQVLVRHDSVRSIRIEAQSNVLNALDVEVRNKELQIGRKNCFIGTKSIKVYVSTPKLIGANLSGSGSIEGIGTFQSVDFRADISGNGSMDFDIDVQNLYCNSSGSGEMRFRGNALYQRLDFSGSGEANNFGLNTRETTVRISGSGDCEVRVSDELDVKISGSGDVYYKGNPTINSKISGSGHIVNKN